MTSKKSIIRTSSQKKSKRQLNKWVIGVGVVAIVAVLGIVIINLSNAMTGNPTITVKTESNAYGLIKLVKQGGYNPGRVIYVKAKPDSRGAYQEYVNGDWSLICIKPTGTAKQAAALTSVGSISAVAEVTCV